MSDDPGMTELEALRIAKAGKANFAKHVVITRLGHAGLWELHQTGVERVTPYVMQGGFDVTEWPTYRSDLTDTGRARLAELEGREP